MMEIAFDNLTERTCVNVRSIYVSVVLFIVPGGPKSKLYAFSSPYCNNTTPVRKSNGIFMYIFTNNSMQSNRF